MDETLTGVPGSQSKGGARGPAKGQIEGARWRWHAGHLEGAAMFSPYMMLHVLFFLGLLQDVRGPELSLLSGCCPSQWALNAPFITLRT